MFYREVNMARAETYTSLSLDRFARILGINPLHFNQVVVSGLTEPSICGMPIYQYSWQRANSLGREEIAQTIADAETRLCEHLGFKLKPTWCIDRYKTLPSMYDPLLAQGGYTPSGKLISVKLNNGYVYGGGVEAKSLIESGASVTYTDSDSDGYFETATILVNTSVTSEDEIAIYYPGEGGNDAWEIRPIQVSITGGVATITCRRELLVRPELQEAFQPTAVDGTDNSLFLSTVDVYRKYTDQSRQVTFYWETTVNGSSSSQEGALNIRDYRLGLCTLAPAIYSNGTFTSTTFSQCRYPDKATIYYYGGWYYKGTKMDPMWERVVAYYACSLLDAPICNCTPLEVFLKYWQEDISLSISSSSGSQSYTRNSRQFDCPLGTTRGAYYAWHAVTNNKIGGL